MQIAHTAIARSSVGRRNAMTETTIAIRPRGNAHPTKNDASRPAIAMPSAQAANALRSGGASIVTDTIETFDETGIRLTSGEHLEADVIVTATGLKLKPFGGFAMT